MATKKQSTRKATRTREASTKNAPKAKKAAAKKATSKAEEKRTLRWSIGVFHGKGGKLSTVYVNAAGEPMPYEQARVGGQPILHFGVYADMPYRDARQQLLKDAAAVGVEDAKQPQEGAEAAQPARKHARKATTAKNGTSKHKRATTAGVK